MIEFQPQILVAGGCSGPCNETSEGGLSSAEIYNPKSNNWTDVADLPVPLHSATMELLADVPTLIGGYDGENKKENDVIYQYDVKNKKWEKFGELQEGRSSPTVVQVPHSYFPFCE